MYNFYDYPIPENRPAWRSAYEIEIAALKHERQRIQMQNEETVIKKSRSKWLAGLLTMILAPLRLLHLIA